MVMRLVTYADIVAMAILAIYMVICGFLSILDPILGPKHLDNDIL